MGLPHPLSQCLTTGCELKLARMPVNPPLTQAGKFFAGLYALYAGLVFIAMAALLFTPFLHRLLHKFHWDLKG